MSGRFGGHRPPLRGLPRLAELGSLGKSLNGLPRSSRALEDGRGARWFNDSKGLGFFARDDQGEDLFAHVSAINMNGVETFKEGPKVQFDVTEEPKGKQASNIQAGQQASGRTSLRSAGAVPKARV